jgi:hypothetical protein
MPVRATMVGVLVFLLGVPLEGAGQEGVPAAPAPVAAPAQTPIPAASAQPAPATQVQKIPPGAMVQEIPPDRPAEAAEPEARHYSTAPEYIYNIRYDHWSPEDERDYRSFIEAIGASECSTLNSCLRGVANPFRASDPPDYRFAADCSDLPYVLRFYFAWKRGLPFSYVAEVAPHDGDGDIRYTRHGNEVVSRIDVPGGAMSGMEIIDRIEDAVNSGHYRIHPDIEQPQPSDFYSPAIDVKSIQPGTAIYDPAGHLAIVYRVETDGRIHFFDAHTDYTLTEQVYDLRFARSRPAHGAGFKNWRPQRLVGATRAPDGTLKGGHIVLAANKEIPDYSVEQYFGTGQRPADENQWESGIFTLNQEELNYYDFVRARLAGGKMQFDPVKEVGEMASSLCSDLHYRAIAVDLALAAGMAKRPQPDRLPGNIYGTSGDWEIYSTPSRDARLKTAFKALRDSAQRFADMNAKGDKKHLLYAGRDLPGDLLAAYDKATRYCRIEYTGSAGGRTVLTFEDARRRLFAMSFDPYHCAEMRWGASGAEAAACPDDPVKRAWYAAEQNLRNQIDRTYEAKMDFALEDLQKPGPGKGVPAPPDTDVRAYLLKIHSGGR